MKLLSWILTILIFSFISIYPSVKKTITFKSGDGVTITADTYIAHDLTAPFIILFHQAGWSRGEYIETAPKLNATGFNCMAVDLRSGNEVNDVVNMTHKDAVKKNKATDYINALPDIDAAVEYAKTNYVKGKFIIWGSSYSAALVIKNAGDHPGMFDGVMSFSPGEYFVKEGKGENYIKNAAKNIHCPVFITSRKSEKENWEKIFQAIPSKEKMSFVPESEGQHGSRALWSKFKESKHYWKAVNKFLSKYFLK